MLHDQRVVSGFYIYKAGHKAIVLIIHTNISFYAAEAKACCILKKSPSAVSS